MENNGSFFKNVPCFLQECTLLLKKKYIKSLDV